MSRDAAVANLIDAVAAWRAVYGRPDIHFEVRKTSADDVMAAYDQLVAIPLKLPTAARTNRLAPLTAIQAGAWMNGDRAASAAGRIVRRMYMNRNRSYTVERLEGSLGMKHQTCSARVHELAKAGWLIADGTELNTSGRPAETYWLTGHAIRLLDLNTREVADG